MENDSKGWEWGTRARDGGRMRARDGGSGEQEQGMGEWRTRARNGGVENESEGWRSGERERGKGVVCLTSVEELH